MENPKYTIIVGPDNFNWQDHLMGLLKKLVSFSIRPRDEHGNDGLILQGHLSQQEVEEALEFKLQDFGLTVFEITGEDQAKKLLHKQRHVDDEIQDPDTTPERRDVLLKASELASRLNEYCLQRDVGPLQVGALKWSGDFTRRLGVII